ncbi:MAG TPA: LysM peptidoglycan-binding domain-containing protein [Anaerolineae bacterium]|nr:LysM peptidoglycan-binding domain-containing protein [Anaerolineae bacterium]
MKQHLLKLRQLPRRVWASAMLLSVLVVPVVYVQNHLSLAELTPTPSPALIGLEDAAGQEAPVVASLTDAKQEVKPVSVATPLRSAPPKATPTLILALLSDGGPLPVQKASVGPTTKPAPTPTSAFIFHKMKRDETVISIAASYGITTEELLVTNDIRDPNKLKPGHILLIPPEDKAYKGKINLHKIKKGDTLLGIAAKYGSSVQAMQEANPALTDDEALKPGETVAVPILFKDPNLVFAKYVDSEETANYIVQPGDMPLSIAAEFNIPVEILLSTNNIADPTLLQIGQSLIIPPHDGITLGFPVVLYELEENDTLIGIATRFGSSVKDILAINPDLDPSDLSPGQLVAVPVIFQIPRPTPPPPHPSVPSRPRPTPGPPPANSTDLVQQLVDRVNAERVAVGLAPYQFDAQLTQAALLHAQDMYTRSFFSHVNPSGETLRDRLADLGISRSTNAGENIQRNTRPRDQTVDTAINWFMSSRPHRNNLLHYKHNSIGVAIVEGPPGWFTFTLVFAEK